MALLPFFFHTWQQKRLLKKEQKNKESVLQLYGFNSFGHEDSYKEDIAEDMANMLNPKKLNININNQSDVSEKVTNWLYANGFRSKNWLNMKNASNLGVSAFVIYLSNGKLNFQTVLIKERQYDPLGVLIQCKIAYESYQKNNLNLALEETFELNNNQVKITRQIWNCDKNKYTNNYKKHCNENLEKSQTLDLSYIPIIIFPNLPTEKSDTSSVEEKIKVSSIFYEFIILDVILNQTKFIINSNSLVGNVSEFSRKTIRDFVLEHTLMMNYDKDNPLPFATINGQFRGKELAFLYDWNNAEIDKRVGLHIPALHKGAQQTRQETSGVNIKTNNKLEQKIWLLEEKFASFIQLLLKFDHQYCNEFGVTNIDNLVIKCVLNINETIEKQINKNENENGVNDGRLEK